MKHHQQSLHKEVQDSSDLGQILTISLVHRKLPMTSTVILFSLSLDSSLFSLKHMMTLRQMQQLKSHLQMEWNGGTTAAMETMTTEEVQSTFLHMVMMCFRRRSTFPSITSPQNVHLARNQLRLPCFIVDW